MTPLRAQTIARQKALVLDDLALPARSPAAPEPWSLLGILAVIDGASARWIDRWPAELQLAVSTLDALLAFGVFGLVLLLRLTAGAARLSVRVWRGVHRARGPVKRPGRRQYRRRMRLP